MSKERVQSNSAKVAEAYIQGGRDAAKTLGKELGMGGSSIRSAISRAKKKITNDFISKQPTDESVTEEPSPVEESECEEMETEEDAEEAPSAEKHPYEKAVSKEIEADEPKYLRGLSRCAKVREEFKRNGAESAKELGAYLGLKKTTIGLNISAVRREQRAENEGR